MSASPRSRIRLAAHPNEEGAIIKIGTKSVLYGVHSLIHLFYDGLAWGRLYGFPWDIRLWFAFAVHDAGYLSKPNLEGPEGERHVELGARITTRFFGADWGALRRALPPLGEALWKASVSAMLRRQAGVRVDAGLALPPHDPCDRRVVRVHAEIPRTPGRCGLTMREIGLRCGINESRVSQIHKRALGVLAVALRDRGITGLASVLPA